MYTVTNGIYLLAYHDMLVSTIFTFATHANNGLPTVSLFKKEAPWNPDFDVMRHNLPWYTIEKSDVH